MYSELTRRIAARLSFIIGLLLMFLGAVFLLGSLEGSSRVSVMAAFLFVLFGAGCAVFAIKLNKRSTYLFAAAFFLMGGIFLFLQAIRIIPVSFSQAWPLLSVFSGLALVPAGWRKYGGFSSRFFVPSCAFVILGCVLLFFSFNLVPFSFSHFILEWWPLLFVLCGLILILISLGTKINSPVSGEKQGKSQT
ncbi:MAG: hypothetical protein LBQ67_03700 [Treponema sp.]|jgi:hypothetical protein|nr:hypothetical protein [Treponema sp.]